MNPTRNLHKATDNRLRLDSLQNSEDRHLLRSLSSRILLRRVGALLKKPSNLRIGEALSNHSDGLWEKMQKIQALGMGQKKPHQT